MTVSRLGGRFPKLTGNLRVSAEFYPPDARRRDLDNVGGKALLDSLQAAGLFEDDSQIKEIHLWMREPMPTGLVNVCLEGAGDGKG